LTIKGELYGSTNSIEGAPYYNPSADGSASLDILAEHVLWRRYEDSLVQALTLNGGWYGQRGFRGGPIGTITYEQRWRFDPRTELVYGASLGKRLYDGDYANEIGAFITLREKI
jgi:biofilm PGA synthesis protein PgaA